MRPHRNERRSLEKDEIGALEVERLFDRGLRRYYMGPGNNAYKHRWTEEGEAVLELTVYSDTLTGTRTPLCRTQLAAS